MNESGTRDELGALEIRTIKPTDAEGLSKLIVRCYGDSYPKRALYQPEELAELIRSEAHGGVVAVSGDAAVGHIAYSWPSRNAIVVEAGTTVVDPEWRGKGVMSELAVALAQQLVAEGAIGFVHFPTTAHTVIQRASLETGGRETGVLLAYIPADTSNPETKQTGDERLAVTVAYQPILESPEQSIFLPSRYGEELTGMADALGLKRRAVPSVDSPTDETRLTASLDTSRGLERITVEYIGHDIHKEIEGVLDDSPAGVFHIDLPMDDVGIEYAVERLRTLGFVFGAWLPGWTGRDVLRLQRIESVSEAELAPQLFSAEAAQLMDSIKMEILSSRRSA